MIKLQVLHQMQKNYTQGLNYQGKKLRLNQLPDPTLFMIIAVFLLSFIFVWVYFHFSFSPSLLLKSLGTLCFGCVVCGGSNIFITICLLSIGGSNVWDTLWQREFSRPASLSFHISICQVVLEKKSIKINYSNWTAKIIAIIFFFLAISVSLTQFK